MKISRKDGESGEVSAARPVCLTGHMGAGKTTVGMVLAARLSRRFFDLDTVIQEHTGKTVRQIFETQGEIGFRDVECKKLAELLGERVPSLIALGGGTLQNEMNHVAIQAADALLIYLTAPIEELWHRCTEGLSAEELAKRPLLAEGVAAFGERFTGRETVYRSAQVSINTSGLSVEEVAQSCQNAISAVQLQKIARGMPEVKR